MNFRLKGNLVPRESNVGIVLVDSKYFPSIVSSTASFVDRARPDEKAILARVVSTRGLMMVNRDPKNSSGTPTSYGLPLAQRL